MKYITLLVIPSGANCTKQIRIPMSYLKAGLAFSFVATATFGYLTFDYLQLRAIRRSYNIVLAENEGLKGESRALMSSLDDVKGSLQRVKDFTTKLTEITQSRIKTISKTTGVKPLGAEDLKKASLTVPEPEHYLPLGLNPDKLFFRPVFDRLYGINQQSNFQAIELQHILSSLGKQQNLLASVPTISPVNGWVTSGFGVRNSPFTGQRTMHKGIDLASTPGAPIYSSADGVVIFSGTKAGFGNFIMIAHGYGIVSRYGHNAQNLVELGQKVQRGEQIATVGDTGRATGPHVHYEVLLNGHFTDPSKFILSMNDNGLLAH